MSVADTPRVAGPFAANGSTTVFPFEFKVLSASDLVVEINNTPVVSGFAVTLNADQNSDPGGRVTFTTAPASGGEVVISSNTAVEQPAVFTNSGGFYPRVLNDSLDRLTIIVQELLVKLNRSVKVPLGEDAGVLDDASARAGKFLAFDASGNPTVTEGTGGGDDLRADLAAVGGIDLVNEVPTGLAADGATDDGPALAARTTSVVLPRQTHYIGTSQFIDVEMECRPGTKLHLANGVTLTPRAGFVGAKEQIFVPEGTGKVNLRQAKLHEAHPEWWPFASGDALAAINAALVAHPLVTLFARDYVVTGTILHQTGFTKLRGTDCASWKSANSATRILSTSATLPIVQIGMTTNPFGGANNTPNHCYLENLFISRNQQPNATSAGAGVAVLFSLEARLENVHSDASVYPFFFSGSTACRVRDTRALRTVACAAGTGTDKWAGYFASGASGLSAINSNASLTFDGVNYAQCSVAATDTTGIRLDGAKTDFFNNGLLETVGGSVGIDIVGSATEGQNNNIDLGYMVIDQCLTRGLRVTNIPEDGRVSSKRIYVGMDTGGGRSVEITGCVGEVCLPDLEIYQAKSTDAAIGITNSAVAKVKAWIKDCRVQAVALTGVTRSKIEVTVSQADENLSTAVQAIANVTDCDITVSAAAPRDGKTMDIGYQSLANTNDRNTVNLRGIASLFSSKKSLASGADANSTFVNG